MLIRSPIVCVLGHVDHGKTTVLDSIRGSRVAEKEAGRITQMIGASYIKREDIEESAKALKGRLPVKLTIPGLLFIDTPGHAAFVNMRDRGGSIADIAILVVDVAQGFQPQTVESLRILKQYKTPFVIAANKIDLVQGWKAQGTTSLLESLSKQPPHVVEKLDEKMYKLMGELSEHGFDSERFDRIADFKKQIAIIPVSAKSKEGISELLVLIAGLSQKFLEGKLSIDENGAAKGTVLEVKDEKGFGSTVDIILYDGVLKKGDEIMFLAKDGPRKTKVRGLLEPNIRGGKDKYTQLELVAAAAGVKVLAPNLEDAISGSPIEVTANFDVDRQKLDLLYKEIIFEKSDSGVIVRSDSLGSLEALLKLLGEKKIPVKEAGIGHVTKKDVISASVVGRDDKYLGAVLAFNVYAMEDASAEAADKKVPLIISDVIYKTIENYEAWIAGKKEEDKQQAWKKLPWPAEVKFLRGCSFRASKPAIFGVKVLHGTLRSGMRLMNAEGKVLGEIREMQHEKKDVEKATIGMELALSCDGFTLGKEVNEDDYLYTYMTVDELAEWEKNLASLSTDEKELLQKIRKMLSKSPW